MNGGDRNTFDKMPNFEKCGLNIDTGLRVNFRKPIFGSEGREPEKEWDAYMESFHVADPFLFDLFAEVKVYYFEPFSKS